MNGTYRQATDFFPAPHPTATELQTTGFNPTYTIRHLQLASSVFRNVELFFLGTLTTLKYLLSVTATAAYVCALLQASISHNSPPLETPTAVGPTENIPQSPSVTSDSLSVEIFRTV